MKSVSTYPRLIALSTLAALGVCIVSAQSYYDDDIYYDPSKVKKEKPVKQEKQKPVRQQTDRNATATQLYYDGAQYVPWNNVGDYQSADSYQPTGTSTRDVDEYNRRYSSTTSSHANQTDSVTLQQFVEMSNTQKLARFQNSEVATQAVGTDNVYYDDLGNPIYPENGTYVSSQPTTTINLNVVGGYPYYGYYGYSSPWYWNSWGYDPWWGGYYSPYWSWGPSWSWSWGPSWSWGWGSSWGWCDPYWGHSHWAYYRPQSSPGAYRPHTTGRNSGAIGSGRYTTGNGTNYRYTGGNRNTATTRPATQGVNSTSRPGYRVPLGNPSTSGNNAARYGSRGRSSSGSFATPTNNSNRGSYNTPSNNSYRNHNNSGSYRNQSSGSFGGSRGGFSSGGSHGGHNGAVGGGGGRRGR